MVGNTEFFECTAGHYDEMISFNNVSESRLRFYSLLGFSTISHAIDLGCGTGADTVALARLGAKVDAYDQSERMVEIAKRNLESAGLSARLFVQPLHQGLHASASSVDIVVSMGNTLANIHPDTVSGLMVDVAESVKDGGAFVFQVVNIPARIAKDKRLIKVTHSAESVYARFYDFLGGKVMFSMIYGKGPDCDLISTEVYPHSWDFFREQLTIAGFSSVQIFGSLALEPFSAFKSEDIVVIAIK